MCLQLAAASYIYIHYALKKKRKERRWWQRQLYTRREVYSGSSLLADLNFQSVGGLYRVSQEECARLRESVPYVKVYRYNPKHLYPKLNGYGDRGQRKVVASCGSKYCNLHS